MVYLSVEELAKSVPDKLLFEGLSFDLKRGDKIGLVADNGTGKSSLLKVLVGKDEADKGTVFRREGSRIGYLPQDPDFGTGLSINELIDGEHTEILQVIREYEQALADQTENFNDQTQLNLERMSAKMDQYDAWDYERRLKQLLDQFNITDLDQHVNALSGGQRKRLALAMALLDKPDVLILDEPTNHLDVEMIEWLENYLLQSNVCLFMVTHDRYFLDRICNLIYELNNGKLYVHQGNYAYFLEKRAERELALEVEVDKAAKLMKKELEWMRRMPKARGTKAKSRVQAFYELKDKASTKIHRQEVEIEMKMARIGGKVLELKKLNKSFGEKVILSGFSHTFKKGERIGVVGKNGVGKSTFLNILTSKEQPDSGKVNVGDNTVYGYYSQDGLDLKEDRMVIDVLKDVGDSFELADGKKLNASQLLNRFAFPPKMQRTYFSKLSGGERRRLFLLTVLMKNPNFLILDEPTNDLDLLTLNKLEDFLESYKGCLIVVSHDRFFMDKLVDQLFIFQGEGEVKGYLGSYRDYREELKEQEKERKKAEQSKGQKDVNRSSVKLSFKEKRELEELETEIEQLETEKSKLEAEIHDHAEDYVKLQAMGNRISELTDLIDEKTMRWMELDEKRAESQM